MINSEKRIGRFTSSQNWKLATNDRSGKGIGEPGLTYIKKKKAERCLGRSIDTGAYAQEMIWGKICEWYLFENELGIEYNLCSKDTVVHKDYPFWSGSPDFQKTNTAVESKCYYPKKYYTLSNALLQLNAGSLTLSDFRDNKADKHNEIFWQVVSNAIILGKTNAEIIAFTPTEKQLLEIKELVTDPDFLINKLDIEPWKARFIDEKPIWELPYIPSDSNWPYMVKYEFEVPKNDVDFLTSRLILAEKIINE